MKNNKGYYNWIHKLNEAAIQSQIFQQQLDEEKAKRKVGGMPGFFSTGPAVAANTERYVPPTGPGAPKVVGVSAEESEKIKKRREAIEAAAVAEREAQRASVGGVAAKLPTREIEAPEGLGVEQGFFKHMVPAEREKQSGEKVDPWPETKETLAAGHMGGLRAGQEEEQLTARGGPQLARSVSMMKALMTGGQNESENMPEADARQAVVDFMAREQAGVKGKTKGKGEAKTFTYVGPSATSWDAMLGQKFPEVGEQQKIQQAEKDFEARFFPKSSKLYDADLSPPYGLDADGDGDYGDMDDLIAGVVAMDQESWGQETAVSAAPVQDPESGAIRADTATLDPKTGRTLLQRDRQTEFSGLSPEGDKRTPQAWEQAFARHREGIYSSRRRENEQRIKAAQNLQYKVPEVEKLTGITDFPLQRRLGGPAGSVGRQMEPSQTEIELEKSRRSSIADINREMETGSAAMPGFVRVSGGEEKVADPEGIIAGTPRKSKLQKVKEKLTKPGVKVRIPAKEEGEEPTLMPGSEFFDREVAANARSPRDATRPSDNPQPDVARTAVRNRGKPNQRTVTLAGSITRAEEPGQSPQDIRDMNAAERRRGIKGAQEQLAQKRAEARNARIERKLEKSRTRTRGASVQESISNIIGRMLYG